MSKLLDTTRAATPRGPSSAAARALFTTSSYAAAEMPQRCGDHCYSYYFVCRAFAPLLSQWGEVQEISGDEAGLNRAIRVARRDGRFAAHLSFLPLQYVPIARDVPNVAFPFWEYPEIPDRDVGGDPRNNWPQVAKKLSLIMTACEFTRESFLRAGVRVPIHVVPVPIGAPYFSVPDWTANQRVVLDCPCYLLPQRGTPRAAAGFPVAARLSARARQAWRRRVRGRLPAPVDRLASRVSRKLLGPPLDPAPVDPFLVPYSPSGQLELSGTVYASVFSPFDERKNWQDLLSSFLVALGDRDDATLVLKLVVSKTMAREGLHRVLGFYRGLDLVHRAKVAVISSYLSDAQMVELARASTFYLNASRAEGACLPLQDFLAAGRPAVAPAHTAMAEYLEERVAFVVPSASEPTHWSWDPERRPTTSWNRVLRPALEEKIRESYELAHGDPSRYHEMSRAARAGMRGFASAESVQRRLSEALQSI